VAQLRSFFHPKLQLSTKAMTSSHLFESGPAHVSSSSPRGKPKAKPKRNARDRARLSPKTLERLGSRQRVYAADLTCRKKQDSADFGNNHEATLEALCKVANGSYLTIEKMQLAASDD